MSIGSHNMLTTAYGSPTCSDTMHVYAMTGALTQAATTFVDATAEAHSGCTRKTILDKRHVLWFLVLCASAYLEKGLESTCGANKASSSFAV
jgi:hypothetical protein